jgi:hypothetical protein
MPSKPLSLTAALANDPTRLDCLTALALRRVVNDEADTLAREGAVAGTFDIDLTVRLVGSIVVMPDGTVKADLEARLVSGSCLATVPGTSAA